MIMEEFLPNEDGIGHDPTFVLRVTSDMALVILNVVCLAMSNSRRFSILDLLNSSVFSKLKALLSNRVKIHDLKIV